MNIIIQGTDAFGKKQNIGAIIFDLSDFVQASNHLKGEPIYQKKAIAEGVELDFDIQVGIVDDMEFEMIDHPDFEQLDDGIERLDSDNCYRKDRLDSEIV